MVRYHKKTLNTDRKRDKLRKKVERKGNKPVYDKRYAKNVEVIHGAEFIRLIHYSQSKEEKLTIGEITTVFDSFVDVIKTALVNGDRVKLAGFGTFIPLRECSTFITNGWDCYRKQRLPPHLKILDNKVFKASKKLFYRINKYGEDYVFETYFGDDLFSDNTEL